MNKKIKILIIFLLLFLCWLIFFGRSVMGTDEKDNVARHNYVHEYSGLVLPVPVDWTVTAETNDHVIFSDSAGKISFAAILEIGGIDYLSASDVAGKITKVMQGLPYDMTLLASQKYTKQTESRRLLFSGNDGKENNLILDTVYSNPFPGIRFYLMAVAGVDDYEKWRESCEYIFEHAYLSKDDVELYKLLPDRTPPENEQK